MSIGRLNHVGIATPSVERSAALWRDMLGATRIHDAFDLPEQGVRVCFVDTPNSQIELIEPLGGASPLRRFLERNPAGGQHHLCFEVPNIAVAAADLAAKGARLLGPPRIGAHGVPVIFLQPADMGGVLIELMEPPFGHP
jgi:methylmalonyl-CoA/ethylmalonyl-CoA epimerase